MKDGNIDIASCLEGLKAKLLSKYPDKTNCDFYFHSQSETVGLDLIYVPPQLQNRGIGDDFMEAFIEIVDRFEWGAMLTASDEHGVPIQKLVEFYSRYGFKIDGNIEQGSRGDLLQKMLRGKPKF